MQTIYDLDDRLGNYNLDFLEIFIFLIVASTLYILLTYSSS